MRVVEQILGRATKAKASSGYAAPFDFGRRQFFEQRWRSAAVGTIHAGLVGCDV
jgi:hypothetical protein